MTVLTREDVESIREYWATRSVPMSPAEGRIVALSDTAVSLYERLAAMPQIECACHPGVRWPSGWGEPCALSAALARAERAERVAAAAKAWREVPIGANHESLGRAARGLVDAVDNYEAGR